MKRPGLTPAMRRALELSTGGKWPSRDVLLKARTLGLVTFECWKSEYEITPRGHAALAAEPMTPAEYELLEAITDPNAVVHYATRVWSACLQKGWVALKLSRFDLPKLTPAGRTQLNNIRAAMPGEWP